MLQLNIYVEFGRWINIERVQNMMKDRDLKKTHGCSWIEINRKIHDFLITDRSYEYT